jgi:tetratricopeptide (TPR) repeat protein
MAEKIGEALLLSRALGALANVLDGRSLLRQHLEIARRRLQVSQADISADPREQIDTQRGVGLALMYVGEYAQALPYLVQAEDLAEKIQATDQVANALGIQAQCLFRMDRWDEVLATEVKWRELEAQHVRERVGET